MKSFKKVALVFALVVMGACLFAGGSSESSSSYKIGFIGPMTGDNANYGILCSQSVKLAVDQANKAGGISSLRTVRVTRKRVWLPSRSFLQQIRSPVS